MTDLPEILRLHKLWLQGDPAGRRAVLRRADLSGADLSGAVLSGADLSGADLSGAVLCDAVLSGAVLCDAVLRRAVLRGAVLSGAVLCDAVLRRADLSGAVLSGAVLSGADLSGADLSGAIGLPIVADAADRLQQVATTVLANPTVLTMGLWHSECGTVHCLAGWAIHLAGPIGATLEALHGPHMAGLLLLGTEAAAHFYDGNEEVLEWLRSIQQQPSGNPG
jgi:hypothetical protein